MIKDIVRPKVEDMAIAIVPPDDADPEALWEVYILNLRETPVKNVLIAARGYGEIDGENRQTTTMRYFFDGLAPQTACMIEPIQPAVFQLNNEYWVSFTFDGTMYDKCYVFVQGSISKELFTEIPLLGKKGILIR